MRSRLFTIILLIPFMQLPRAGAQEPQTQLIQTPNSVNQNTAAVPTDRAAPPTIETSIAQLTAQNFSTRDNAEHYLMRQSPENLATIELALATAEDSEAVMRLTRIAMHLYLKGRTQFVGQASILGIRMNMKMGNFELNHKAMQKMITVMELQPGFPAAEVLYPGDQIIGINHEPFGPDMEIDWFPRLINTFVPGTTVQFTILRAARSKWRWRSNSPACRMQEAMPFKIMSMPAVPPPRNTCGASYPRRRPR